MKNSKTKQVQDAYDNIAVEYGGFYKRKKYWQEIDDFIKKTNGKILDVGCGNCASIGLSKIQNKRYFGFDVSLEQLKIGKKNFSKLVQGDMKKLPYKTESIDNILCIASLHHLEKEHHLIAIKEIKRVLKKNGKLIITVWYKYQKRFMPKAILFSGTIVPFGKYNRFYYLFSKKELSKLLLKAGFKINSIGIKTIKNKSKKNNWVVNKNIFVVCEK